MRVKKRWNWKDIMTMIYSIKNEHHSTRYEDQFTNSQLWNFFKFLWCQLPLHQLCQLSMAILSLLWPERGWPNGKPVCGFCDVKANFALRA
jgi:DNA-binding MltR family transcriptional regulator